MERHQGRQRKYECVFNCEIFVFLATRSSEACVETLYCFGGFVYRFFLIDCCSLENRCVRQ